MPPFRFVGIDQPISGNRRSQNYRQEPTVTANASELA
jgi:hypothetical protein